MLGDGSCTDMSGCIEAFKKIDSEVVKIETMGPDRKDTTYKLIDGKWEAFMPQEDAA
jgi:hypothetical protein